MNTIRNARSVVLDNETYLLIESLKRSLATNGTADLQSTIDDGIKLCDILLGQYGLVASLHEDQTSLSDWKEKKAKDLIISKLSAHVQISDIAKECYLSRSHFSRAFKTSTGLSPKNWLIHKRIQRAQELLLNPILSLTEIGLDCGFSDQSHFTRTFGRIVGLTPFKWRRES